MFFRIFQHLLPTGQAWRTTVSKTLRSFFEGLAPPLDDARDYLDAVWADAFPDTTTQLAAWEAQYGLQPNGSEATRRLALAAAWAAGGGQDPSYIQGVLQTAGYAVFVHSFWISGPPYLVRDPRDYTTAPEIGSAQCNGTNAPGQPQCGSGLPGRAVDATVSQYQCDAFLQNDPHYFNNKNLTRRAPPPIPNDPDRWQYFLYFGGESFPDHVTILASNRADLERLILKLRPLENWVVTLIDYEGAALLTEGSEPIITESGDALVA